MKLDFLHTVPYVCARWAEVARQAPDAPFLTEETSGISYSRRQADDLSAPGLRLFEAQGHRGGKLRAHPASQGRPALYRHCWAYGRRGLPLPWWKTPMRPERIEAIERDCHCRLVIDEDA